MFPAGEPSTLQAVGVPLDSGFAVGSTDTKVLAVRHRSSW